MVRRRSFLGFFCGRLLKNSVVYGFLIIFVSTGLTVGLSSWVQAVPPFVGMLVVLSAISFLEYDSQPRGLRFSSGWKLDIEDASGQITEGIEFGVKQYFWITRIIYCRNGKVIKIPLEAFCISRREVISQASGEN